MKKLTVISLGWGVQSWVMAAMSALGELPKVDFAIHSDTTWEREFTYQFAEQWTPWLEARGVKVITVNDREQARKVYSNKTDIPARKRGDVPIFIPAYSRNESNPTDQWGGVSGNAYTTAGTGFGQLRRQCTQRWKIVPMRRFISQELKRRGWPKSPGIVEQWIGITIDEIQRAKDGDVKYIEHRFPLLEKKMRRVDCLAWLDKNDLPTPGKSSCVFCPYHNHKKWEIMKRNNGPDWQTAKMVDKAIRDKRPPYPLFVHEDRLPLDEAVKIPEDNGYIQGGLWELVSNDDDAECDSGYCFL